MKILLAKLLIAILRKMNVSVAIGLNIKSGEMFGKNKFVFWYDSTFTDTITKTHDGEIFTIPKSAFRIDCRQETTCPDNSK